MQELLTKATTRSPSKGFLGFSFNSITFTSNETGRSNLIRAKSFSKVDHFQAGLTWIALGDITSPVEREMSDNRSLPAKMSKLRFDFPSAQCAAVKAMSGATRTPPQNKPISL